LKTWRELLLRISFVKLCGSYIYFCNIIKKIEAETPRIQKKPNGLALLDQDIGLSLWSCLGPAWERGPCSLSPPYRSARRLQRNTGWASPWAAADPNRKTPEQVLFNSESAAPRRRSDQRWCTWIRGTSSWSGPCSSSALTPTPYAAATPDPLPSPPASLNVPDLTYPVCARVLCRRAMWWSTGTARGSSCSRSPTTARYRAWPFVHYKICFCAVSSTTARYRAWPFVHYKICFCAVSSGHGRLVGGFCSRCQWLVQPCCCAYFNRIGLIKS
jgi:hypothetical protein